MPKRIWARLKPQNASPATTRPQEANKIARTKNKKQAGRKKKYIYRSSWKVSKIQAEQFKNSCPLGHRHRYAVLQLLASNCPKKYATKKQTSTPCHTQLELIGSNLQQPKNRIATYLYILYMCGCLFNICVCGCVYFDSRAQKFMAFTPATCWPQNSHNTQ